MQPYEVDCLPDGADDWEPAHVGHWSTFGTYWCDTCNSPYCNLA